MSGRIGPLPSYIVDEYSPDYCWTVERVKSTETDLVLVRRSSDSAELAFTGVEISDGTLTTWTGTNTGDHGYVVTWYNQGITVMLDPTQTTAGRQPRLVIDGKVNLKNGKPSVLYDGVDDYNSNKSYGTLYQAPLSVFSVANNETSAGNGLFFANRNSAGAGFLMKADRSTSKNPMFVRSNNNDLNFWYYPTQLNTNELRLQTFILDSGEVGETWLGSVSQDTFTLTSTYNYSSLKTLMIGGQAAGGQRYNVNVSMIVGFNSDQTSNRTSVETKINTIYGTY